ncbi:hypothetical protein THOM_2273 [Trachipleistophora hominis]|uniref:Uncharacterized protein n=1 Tax=Trachipleistophora hominis TaxID=72359 RepID=L7JUT1_TRAHO|nr:hypothetical protein THOM_2273 [Trachipleistophora hominis]
MLVCEHCGTSFISCDGILVCKNGHVLEQNLEVVEDEFAGRKASSSLKPSVKKKSCSNFTHLRILFKVYKDFKKKYDLNDDIMKIFLQNIRFTGVLIKKSKSLVSINLLVLVLYLSLRIKKSIQKPYFIRDFVDDISDLRTLTSKHKLENDCRERNALLFINKVNMVYLMNQLDNLDLEFNMNSYMLSSLDCGFIVFVRYFLRVVKDISGVYDFRNDENFQSSELDFRKFNIDKKTMIESLLRIRSCSLINEPEAKDKDNRDEVNTFPFLQATDFKVQVDNAKDGDICIFFINGILRNLYILNTSQIARETLTSYFLKFLFISDFSDRLFFYELEVCSFLYAYAKSKNKSDALLLEMLNFILKYLDCSEPFFARYVRKIFKIFKSSQAKV